MNPETTRLLFFQMAYRPLGRLALIIAFILGLSGNAGAAIASLAVALWMIWSSLLHIMAELGMDIESRGKENKP